MSKTDNAALVGIHKFEAAGLGKAPFRFVGLSENAITYPDGTTKAGGSCDYCSTGIRHECWVLSADGKRFKVGSNCIEKVGDQGLFQAYKNSPEFRKAKRDKAQAKFAADLAEVHSIIDANKDALLALPHPYGFKDFATGKPLTYLDQVEWSLGNCGAAGTKSWLKTLKKKLALS
jgi:hypothetical protein